MALEPDPHLKDTVNKLYDAFLPIYNEWYSAQSANPSIATLVLPKTAEECLHKDIYLLGKAFAGSGHHCQLDMNLLAEIWTLLNRNKSAMPYEYQVQTADKEIGSQAVCAIGESGDIVIPDLLTVQVINDWVNGNPTRKSTARTAIDALMELVNDFVLREGNVTLKEMSALDALEKKFA